MRKALIYLNIILLICSCKNDDDQKQIETEEFNIRINSQINIPPEDSDFFVATIDTGNKQVFEYNFDSPSDPQIADSGFSEIIIFEIQSDIEEFNLKNEELNNINAFYRAICFCPNTESVRISEGTISGKKINSTSWTIQIDVKIDLDSKNIDSTIIDKKITHIFTKI